ncbi:MAG: methyltransferase [Isosphaerales bacterium]
MASSTVPQCQPGEDFDFLCVDEFLTNIVAAQALKSALALRLIDQLGEEQPSTLARLERTWRGDHRGLRLLLDLLAANQVVERIGDEVRLTPRFRVALRFRDLLEAKLDFANLAAPDLIQHFPWLFVDPDGFMQKARIFNLFDYNRCLEPSPENYEATKRWMRFTTCLTRYEAAACMRFHDFSRYASMLDVGGNSGEFLLRVCKNHPRLRGTVFDLPVVCDIGRDHVRREPEAPRIAFVKGSALVDPLPTGFDLITFKSMLHDWSNDDATRILTRASQFLDAGATLLIFERAPIEVGTGPVPYWMIPMLLFFRNFRSPLFYQERLKELGFEGVEIQTIHLEMPFFLVTARRGG